MDPPSAQSPDALDGADEGARLKAVRRLAPFTRPGDALMVSIATEAAEVCAASIGIVSLLEENVERFVGSVGIDVEEADRDVSMCAFAILEPNVLVVEDTLEDARFRSFPWVVRAPYVRFYVGAPIFDRAEMPVGAVCVLHTRPHHVSSRCLIALERLATVASAVLETRFLQAHPLPRDAPPEEIRYRAERLDGLLLRVLTPRLSSAERAGA